MNRETRKLRIAGPAGAIEVEVDEPATSIRGVMVLCHPHPQHGGSMGNKVVQTLARAFLHQPDILFLDEPTAGLDPIGAAAFDTLTQSLQKTLGFTVFLITHDLDTLYAICDRVAVLADRKVIGVGTIPELLAMDHPWIQEYFNGPRGRAATAAVDRNSETRA